MSELPAFYGRQQIEALYDELDCRWKGEHYHEQLVRDAHLGIALSDA